MVEELSYLVPNRARASSDKNEIDACTVLYAHTRTRMKSVSAGSARSWELGMASWLRFQQDDLLLY